MHLLLLSIYSMVVTGEGGCVTIILFTAAYIIYFII